MKLFFCDGTLFLLFFVLILNVAVPNYVKIINIVIETDSCSRLKNNLMRISFADDLGRNLQTKSNINPIISRSNPTDSTRFFTKCLFYVDTSKPEISTKTFVKQTVNHLLCSFSDVKISLNNSYRQYAGNSDCDRIAYSKTVYYNDPLSRVYELSNIDVNN